MNITISFIISIKFHILFEQEKIIYSGFMVRNGAVRCIHLVIPRPSIHSSIIHPSNHPFISIYLSIYLSIYRSGTEMSWYRNALVPKRLGAESSRDFFLGWCRNILVPKRLGPNRLGAETTWCRNVCKSEKRTAFGHVQ